jgi:hypothetical protein
VVVSSGNDYFIFLSHNSTNGERCINLIETSGFSPNDKLMVSCALGQE